MEMTDSSTPHKGEISNTTRNAVSITLVFTACICVIVFMQLFLSKQTIIERQARERNPYGGIVIFVVILAWLILMLSIVCGIAVVVQNKNKMLRNVDQQIQALMQ